MSIGKQSDFTLYDAQYQMGKFESLARSVKGFNAASNNAIRLVQQDLIGQFEKEAFFNVISGLISRRDLTSVEAADDLAMTQGEEVGVKLARLVGPVAQSLNSFKKLGMDNQEMSLLVGRMVGQAKSVDMLDVALIALQATIDKQATTKYDATGQSTKTMTHTHLVDGLAKMGDAAGRIRCWVMHSRPYFELMKQSLADAIFEVAGLTVRQGSVETLGIPVIVTDSAALFNNAGSANDTFNTLGLVQDAVVITESEREEMVVKVVTGLQQLVMRIQGEYDINARVKGFKFSTASDNPTDANLGSSANWTLVASDIKNGPGIEIITKSSSS